LAGFFHTKAAKSAKFIALRLADAHKNAHIMCLMNEIVFEVTQEADGGYVAEALGESIFTEADNWDKLRSNVQEAVKAFYFDQSAPKQIRLRLVRDELLAAS
jgi:hypothetical protein